jgi:hypothetical protein
MPVIISWRRTWLRHIYHLSSCRPGFLVGAAFCFSALAILLLLGSLFVRTTLGFAAFAVLLLGVGLGQLVTGFQPGGAERVVGGLGDRGQGDRQQSRNRWRGMRVWWFS